MPMEICSFVINLANILDGGYKTYKLGRVDVYLTTAVLIILSSKIMRCNCGAQLNLLTLPKKLCWQCGLEW